ncbi:MAG: hypothetical protein DDT26_01747 [Dehalococcoidia bacterium]|nr:hypothetical protein [Chloroflexota bacterium]
MKKTAFVKNYLPPIEAAVADKVLEEADRPLSEWREIWKTELNKPIN